MDMCAIFWRVWLHVAIAGVIVEALRRDIGGAQNVAGTVQRKPSRLRHKRYIEDDEFSFMKSAHQANEIVHSLEMIENEHPELPLERRSDIAHVLDRAEFDSSGYVRNFIASAHSPVSPHKLYRMDPHSFTPLYQKKFTHRPKNHATVAKLRPRPSAAEATAVPHEKEDNSNKNSKYIVTIPAPEFKSMRPAAAVAISDPRVQEDIRIDFTNSAEVSDSQDSSNKESETFNLLGSGDENLENSGVIDKQQQKDTISGTDSGYGEDDIKGSRKTSEQLQNTVIKNEKLDPLFTAHNSSNIPSSLTETANKKGIADYLFISGDSDSESSGKLDVGEHGIYANEQIAISGKTEFAASGFREDIKEGEDSSGSGDDDEISSGEKDFQKHSSTKHGNVVSSSKAIPDISVSVSGKSEEETESAFEFPTTVESDNVDSEATYKTSASGDGNGNRDLMLSNNDNESGQGSTSYHQEDDVPITEKQEQKLTAKGDDYVNSGDKTGDRHFSGDTSSKTKLSGMSDSDGETFGESDEDNVSSGKKQSGSNDDMFSGNDDESGTSGSNVGRRNEVTDKETNKSTSSSESDGERVSSDGNSVTRNGDIGGSAQTISAKGDFVSGESGSGEIQGSNFGEDFSFLNSGDTVMKISRMQDAQKHNLSVQPGNVSNHDQISNSSALKEISKQLGFPAHTAKLPKKSNDEDSLPSVGSYNEEPDLIKAEENQSIQSSPLFEHSSGEHSGEDESEHSSGEHSGEDESEHSSGEYSGEDQSKGSAMRDGESSGLASGSGGSGELSSAHDHSFRPRPQIFSALEEEYSGSSGFEMQDAQKQKLSIHPGNASNHDQISNSSVLKEISKQLGFPAHTAKLPKKSNDEESLPSVGSYNEEPDLIKAEENQSIQSSPLFEHSSGEHSGEDESEHSSGEHSEEDESEHSSGEYSGEDQSKGSAMRDGESSGLASGSGGSGELSSAHDHSFRPRPQIFSALEEEYSGSSGFEMQDAQKQKLSIHPGNASNHDQISNSSVLKEISKQLGFPAHTAKLPNKSNDEESLPSAGSYNEEPDLIKAEENQSIQSSPLFEHSSGEHSGEDESEHSSGEHSGEDGSEHLSGEHSGEDESEHSSGEYSGEDQSKGSAMRNGESSGLASGSGGSGELSSAHDHSFRPRPQIFSALEEEYSGSSGFEMQDAQKQKLSTHPGNASNHDQISNSSVLKEISKQLGFPAHTAKLPKKSNDEESLPSAGSYNEEPDLIKAEENQSIQSSPLFEHSSGEHSGEDESEHSSGEYSGEDELEGSATRDSESSGLAIGSGGSRELSSAHDHNFKPRPQVFSALEEEYSGGSGFEMHTKQDSGKNVASVPKHVGEDRIGESTQSYLSAEQEQSAKEENTKITAALGKLEQQLVARLKEIESKNKHTGSRNKFGYKHFDRIKVGHHIEVFQPHNSGEVPQVKPRKHYSAKSGKVTNQHRQTSYKGKYFKESQKIKGNTTVEQQIQVAKPSVQTVERIQLVGGKEKNLQQSAPSKPKLPVTSETEHHEEPEVSNGQENENLESVSSAQKPTQKIYPANSSSDTISKMTYLKAKLDQMKSKAKKKQKQKLATKLEEVSETRMAEKLLTQLDKLKFGHDPGTVWRSSRFQYVKQCGLYVEQYNVTKIGASWNDNPWQTYPYLYDVPDNYHECHSASWMNNTDFRGDVFLSFQVHLNNGRTEQDHARVCSKICCAKTRCRAWTLRFQKASTRNCPKSTFCCWLKSAVPTPITNQEYCTSGIAGRKDTRNPPTGMRSAVPLGGMGTGSFELRADGTFHEWTIENQSPGGSAKLNKGALDLAVFGVRVASEGTSTSSLLRVHPPHGYPGVAALSYSGAFPVAKLSPAGLLTREVDMDLYAYSAFHPRESRKSATPAVAFTLGLHNKRGKVPKEVSFMFNLPLGVQHDTIRAGNNFGEVVFTRLIKPSDCAYACAKMPKCVSWTTNGPTSCMLKNQMPLHSWASGIVTGLKGEWSVVNSMLTLERPGFFPQSGSTTLLAVDYKDTNTSFAVVDDFQQIWKQFAETGNVGANESVSRVGLYGAASLRTVLQPGESKSLTIVMSWYYPHRDIARLHVGNFYSTLFSSSKDVALHMRRDLLPSIKDIRSWQGPFFLPLLSSGASDSPKPEVEKVSRLPVWFQDMMMNSVSFWRSGFWTEDKKWRQWEALDCNKIDSVQNDMQRIMPYVLFFPEFVRDLLVSWSKTQLSDGMIEEALTTGCLGKTGKLDYAGGRSMGDTTSLFVVELYHYYLWTNDTELLDRLWPAAKRAASWSMGEATKGTGLPFRKANVYDLLSLDKYDHSIYNSIVYLLTLRAAEKLTVLKNDTSFGRLIKETYVKASKRVDLEMWDKPKGFYHAWWDMEYGSPSWIMSDSLYGQVWAYTLGLGELLDVKKLRSHLEKEVENNDTPFGLKALSTERKEMNFEDTSVILGRGAPSCRSLENITKHNSVWMGADASWATNMIHLGVDPSRALNRVRKALDHWRATLNDQWNIHGLTSSSGYGLDGLPWATSHYSSHLVMWHIPLALSGQQYSAPDASLTFSPRYNAPYELPFFTPTASGTITATHSTGGDNKHEDNEEMYTLSVVSGKLYLKRLAVSGTTYGKGEITLHQGDMVSWSKPQNTIRDILSQLKH